MTKISIRPFIKIPGAGAASGLHFKNGSLFVISDNRNVLLEYNLTSGIAKNWPLFADSAPENLPKSRKPDFEAIAADGNLLYIFGSGSAETRNKLIIFNTDTKAAEERDLSLIYQNLRNIASIAESDFNIEGAAVSANQWILLQRGNGPENRNGLFVFSANPFKEACEVDFYNISLPEIGGYRASFTDATVVGNRLFFIAAAEAGNSTYEDGAVAGSLIGAIDLESLRLQFTESLSNSHKFEGISLFEENENTLSFLVCEDNDSDDSESTVQLLTLRL